MQQYHDLLKHVLDNGTDKSDRTGTGTRSVFGYQMRFNLQDGFPLVTTKKVSFNWITKELIWFLSGCQDGIKGFQSMGVTIWDEWLHFEKEGRIVPYGKMWREWNGRYGKIDQINNLLWDIEHTPNSRRLIVECWNVDHIDNEDFVLPPCHKSFQMSVEGNKLSCKVEMRSNDLFLGNPYNVAQYALLTHIIANICNLEVGELIFTIADAHIYHNHFEQVELQLSREPYPLPQLEITRKLTGADLCRFPENHGWVNLSVRDFKLHNYQHHDAITAPVAI